MDTVSFPALDDVIQEHLDQWRPRLGAPSCKSGCASCCSRPVMATSAEMLSLIEHIESRGENLLSQFSKVVDDHVSLIRMNMKPVVGQAPDNTAAKQLIAGLGSCAFLKDQKCSIYEARPYACRAVHVWHDSSRCVRYVEWGFPAELMLERNRMFWDTLEKEALANRFPFYGQLTVGLYYLLRYRDLYLSGSEFSTIIDPIWWQTGTIVLPYQNSNCTPQDALRTIREMKKQDELECVKEKPFGLIRVADIASKEELIELEGVEHLP